MFFFLNVKTKKQRKNRSLHFSDRHTWKKYKSKHFNKHVGRNKIKIKIKTRQTPGQNFMSMCIKLTLFKQNADLKLGTAKWGSKVVSRPTSANQM